MSALPPKADIGGASSDVRFVPKADIVPAPISTSFEGCPAKISLPRTSSTITRSSFS
jgi:hypothetical protein